jgi:guanine deaminase
MVFCTVHPESVDALFEAAERIQMRLIAGKVLMDRHAPDGLCDTPQSAYDDSKALLKNGMLRAGRSMRLPHVLHQPRRQNN